jgi:hypothetical protein
MPSTKSEQDSIKWWVDQQRPGREGRREGPPAPAAARFYLAAKGFEQERARAGLVDLLGGHVGISFTVPTSVAPHIRAGKLRPLLALSGDRITQLPDVPSLKDIGSKPFDGGTTAVQLARHLAPDLQATVVTHSPSVAVELISARLLPANGCF